MGKKRERKKVMGGQPLISFEVTEFTDEDGEPVGYSICDPADGVSLYQIACPNGSEDQYSLVQVAHEDPFEYVNIGFVKTKEEAFSQVRQRLIADVLRDAISGNLKKRLN